jgi:hypothetical protein
MAQFFRVLMVLLGTSFAVWASHAQTSSDDPADTSGAQAAILAAQEATQLPKHTQEAFPALKAEACKVVVPYVESPTGLLGEWDQSMRNLKSDRVGIASFQNIKSDLLSETWWARSSGADVARNLKTFCSLLIDVSAALSPTGEAASFAKEVGSDFGSKVKEESVKLFDAINNGGDAMAVIQGGMGELSYQASQGALKRAGGGQFSSIIDILKVVQEHSQTTKEAANFKSEVQAQLHRLDEILSQYTSDVALQRERQEAIESVKDTVIATCNAGQPIQRSPEFATNSAESSKNSTVFQTPIAEPASPPWWLTALSSVSIPARTSTLKPLATKKGAVQAPAPQNQAICDRINGQPVYLQPGDKACR